MLNDAGHQAYFVGGCVRNALIGAPVSDLDVCTNARPDETIALARAAGLKAVPTGYDHGTITVIAEGIPYEVTTFRRDVQTDGRHAVVAFADTIQEDARRRDFTMNALYADASGAVHDPVDGVTDLTAGHVRFIGDPEARITEDYLRILRFFRFSAWYGNPDLGIDADGLAACAAHIDGLDLLSVERVTSELLKLLAAPDPSMAVASLASIGGLAALLPGASSAALAVLVHLEHQRGPDPVRRLAVIGGETAKLRLSKADRRKLESILAGIGTDLKELGYRFPETAADSYLVQQASIGQPLDPADLARIADAATQVFPVSAADLMPRYTGPALGQKLKQLEQKWIDSGFALSASELCAD